MPPKRRFDLHFTLVYKTGDFLLHCLAMYLDYVYAQSSYYFLIINIIRPISFKKDTHFIILLNINVEAKVCLLTTECEAT